MKVDEKVAQDLKEELKANNKGAVRFKLNGFGWGGPSFDIVLDEQKEEDASFIVNGVNFIVEDELASFVENAEIIKVGSRFHIREHGC